MACGGKGALRKIILGWRAVWNSELHGLLGFEKSRMTKRSRRIDNTTALEHLDGCVRPMLEVCTEHDKRISREAYEQLLQPPPYPNALGVFVDLYGWHTCYGTIPELRFNERHVKSRFALLF